MSTFKVEVVKVGTVKKHPNADSLSIVQVGGYPVVIRTSDFAQGDLAAYVPEDSVVKTNRPEFSHMKGKNGTARIKAVRLRGVYSEGLLVPAPKGSSEGQDVADLLEVVKYEQPTETGSVLLNSVQESPPKEESLIPRCQIEALFRNPDVIPVGAEVVFTEKIHGCSSRYVYTDSLRVGSHNVWRRGPQRPDKVQATIAAIKLVAESVFSGNFRNLKAKWKKAYGIRMAPLKEDVWWKIARKYDLAKRLKSCKNVVLYGEVYGHVQDLTYEVAPRDVVKFVLFDAFLIEESRYLSYYELRELAEKLDLPMAPEIFQGPMPTLEEAKAVARGDGKSLIAPSQIREGAVVKAVFDTRPANRMVYKIVTEEYKLRNNGTEHK